MERAARYSGERDGDAVVVFRHDSLVLEDYQNGYDGREPHGLASGSKAFACALAALAEADGLIRMDAPAAAALPSLRGDSLRAQITIRQLLNLTNGLTPDGASPSDLASAASLPMAGRPGAQFAYGGTGFHVFAALIRQRLRDGDVAAYLERRVFRPLDMSVLWARDGSGLLHLASGAVVTARDWGAYGLLLLHRGAWHGRQILPANLVAQCVRGSAANPWFGLGLWLNAREPRTAAPAGVTRVGVTDRRLYAPDLPADIFLAAGTAGQRLYVVPSAALVIVRFGHNTGPEFKDDEFLRLALGAH